MTYHYLGAEAETLPHPSAGAQRTPAQVDRTAADALALTLGRTFTPGEMEIIAEHMTQARCFSHERAATPAISEAESIVNSSPVINIYAACEWDCLEENGQVWIAAIVAEAQRRARAA